MRFVKKVEMRCIFSDDWNKCVLPLEQESSEQTPGMRWASLHTRNLMRPVMEPAKPLHIWRAAQRAALPGEDTAWSCLRRAAFSPFLLALIHAFKRSTMWPTDESLEAGRVNKNQPSAQRWLRDAAGFVYFLFVSCTGQMDFCPSL